MLRPLNFSLTKKKRGNFFYLVVVAVVVERTPKWWTIGRHECRATVNHSDHTISWSNHFYTSISSFHFSFSLLFFVLLFFSIFRDLETGVLTRTCDCNRGDWKPQSWNRRRLRQGRIIRIGGPDWTRLDWNQPVNHQTSFWPIRRDKCAELVPVRCRRGRVCVLDAVVVAAVVAEGTCYYYCCCCCCCCG